MVAELIGGHRTHVDNVLSGSNHGLDLAIEVAWAVLALLEERWRGLQPSYRSRQATDDLRGLLVSMEELQVHRGG